MSLLHPPRTQARQSAVEEETQQANNSSDGGRRKTHIGPWHLGRTLGKGATARVRMARHCVTGQPAAIKIVSKKNNPQSQAGSLAALDRLDAAMTYNGEGPKRMPYGIEREVAIMKLIDHPHIMKLYDIWENRTEIYLVLEYVDNGELFKHISKHGWLGEDEALKYFRQLLSAVEYCHSLNICHRDLKPENILLTKSLEIKVADFGMAALHQTPGHLLQTPCGSPHYAAPEVIKGSFYCGDKADIWSMGVILFASLVGYLPFDHKDLPGLLKIIKKGRFQMPSQIGPEASDLVHRMLQLNPRNRISISQMWRHPLLRKYNYLDNHGGGLSPHSPVAGGGERRLLRHSDIDPELLRHLRSMWYTFEEQQIIKLLISDEPNEQKVFYDLLLRHRAAQLKNYVPDINHSTSDHHLVRPLTQVKKLSTQEFSQPSQKGHRGQPVVQEAKAASRSLRKSSSASRVSRARQHSAPPRAFASRKSLASSTRSRGSDQGSRLVLSYRHRVNFSHMQKLSRTSQNKGGAMEFNQVSKIVAKSGNLTNDGSNLGPLALARYIRSRKTIGSSSQPLHSFSKHDPVSRLWDEDLRQLSSSLAKTCDDAFNRASLVSTVHIKIKSLEDSQDILYDNPISSFEQAETRHKSSAVAPLHSRIDRNALNSRPLPPTPTRSDSADAITHATNNVDLAILSKKRGGFDFGSMFNRRSIKKEVGMSIPRFEFQDDSASIAESIEEEQRHSQARRVTNFENSQIRQIKPQQNWLARLFHVKPATRLICSSVTAHG